ncbi:ABC transporter ATP-binding protein [Akkermansia muciniphila]|uniref:ABC transporter ATP-binding protein n=1 Tax=Akkermansia muciniphila TaxID=239935 RepID=UPI00122ED915|nr:ABC transporter ATP-binding protein [Akkermansia muciniphila]
MSLLDVKDLTIQFGGLVAVDHVNFHINEGEIISIIGPNGAGKTTIFNMLTGLYVPGEGTIEFEGQQIQGKRPQDIIKMGIARTFQNIKIFNDLRVIENIMIGSHVRTNYGFLDAIFKTKKYHREEREKCAAALEFLESMHFADKADMYAASLPYGDLRRLEILRAMASGAKLLLLDEPAAGMNPQESAELVEFISKIVKEDGYTVLLIEHDMNVVMNVADRIYVVDYGKLIAEGLPEEIRTNPDVIRAYLGGVKA